MFFLKENNSLEQGDFSLVEIIFKNFLLLSYMMVGSETSLTSFFSGFFILWAGILFYLVAMLGEWLLNNDIYEFYFSLFVSSCFLVLSLFVANIFLGKYSFVYWKYFTTTLPLVGVLYLMLKKKTVPTTKLRDLEVFKKWVSLLLFVFFLLALMGVLQLVFLDERVVSVCINQKNSLFLLNTHVSDLCNMMQLKTVPRAIVVLIAVIIINVFIKKMKSRR